MIKEAKINILRCFNDASSILIEVWDTDNKDHCCVYIHVPLKLLPTTNLKKAFKKLPPVTYTDISDNCVVIGWDGTPKDMHDVYTHLQGVTL